MMKTVLLTGFEPFGGERLNPSAEIVGRLHGEVIARHRVQSAVLPCVFGAAVEELKRNIRAAKPALVICVGQAGGRAEITPERVAINIDDARIADNAGARPVDVPIVRGGAAAYFSTLPIKAIVAALRDAGVPAAVSQTAGTFVCNHVFYGLMRALRRRPGVRGGFMHVPLLPAQATAGQPSLPLATLVAAVRIAVEVSLKTRRDVHATGGREH